MRSDYDVFKYGLLHDKTIVKIHSWTNCNCCKDELQEIYFNYTSIFNKKKSAWTYKKNFIAFAKTKRELKKLK